MCEDVIVRKVIALFSLVLIIFFLVFASQNLKNIPNKLVVDTYAQACAAPATPAGLTVEYPSCNGNQCDLAQAECTWSSQADVSSFNLTITEVESGVLVKNNESESASTTKIVFPVTQGRTYRCSLVAVSSCGGLSTAATNELMCEADAMLTPSPTIAVPTATPTPTPANTPPVANAGSDQSGFKNQSINFNGSLSSDQEGSISLYYWNFGDGANATGVSPSHTYTNLGTYTVTLSVTD